jgi:hypothetical protein
MLTPRGAGERRVQLRAHRPKLPPSPVTIRYVDPVTIPPGSTVALSTPTHGVSTSTHSADLNR